MNKSIVFLYAQILDAMREVTIDHEGCLIRIWWSADGDGWYIEVLEEGVDGWKETNGGKCTGEAIDAVEFFL